MNLFTRQKQTSRLRKKLRVTEGKDGGEIDWKFKTDMCTLLYLKQNAFHEITIKAMKVVEIKRWSIFSLRYPVWCLLPHEAASLRATAIQSCPTLCETMTSSSLGLSVHGNLQARILEWVAIPFLRGSSWPRDRTHVAHASCIGRQILYHEPLEKEPQPFPSHVPWGCWGSRARNRTVSPSVWIHNGY